MERIAKHILVVLCLSVLAKTGDIWAFSYSGHRWAKGSTVTFYMNQNGTPDCSNEVSALQAAMQAWTNVTTADITLQYGGTTSNSNVGIKDGTNLIMWVESGWTSLFPDYPSAIALTLSWYDGASNQESDVAFNGESYTWSDNGQAGRMDVQNVATHELGHTFSLGNLYGAGDAEKTMYAYISTGETRKRTLETDDEDGARYIYFDPTLSGTLSGSQKWVSSLDMGTTVSPTGDVTVPSGKSLAISSGMTVSPTGYYKLRVEGTLSTSGSTTFTRSGSQWYGIEFYNGQAGSSLSYATIENAYSGVSVYNTEVGLSNCTLQNNTIGLYANQYSAGVSGSTFQNNDYGVQCASYGSPNLSPSNRIRYNYTDGVYADGTSQPYFGSSVGYDSFYGNGDWDIYASYSGTIYALGNYWGAYGPWATPNVDCSNPLGSDPNPAKVSAQAPRGASQGLNLTSEDTVGLAAVEALRLALLTGQAKPGEIVPRLQELTLEYPEKLAGRMALATFTQLEEARGTDVSASLAAVASEKPGTAVAKTARLFSVGSSVKAGRHAEAYAQAVSLVNEADKATLKDALFNAGSLAWYSLGNREEGESYFKRLITEYPDDPLAASARSALGIPPVKIAAKGMPPEAVPSASDLLPSYPNPFNPSTTIRFALASDAHVRLAVYDILGREVARLADGLHQAGYHTFVWNAQQAASGLYFARLTVANILGRTLFSKTDKLMLTR